MSTNAFIQSVAGSGLAALVAGIGPNSVLAIYDGTEPADSGAALAANNLLVSGTISAWGAPAYSAPASGMVSNATFTSSGYAPSSGGVASFARLLTSGAVCVRQATVTATGGGGEVQLGNINIQLGTQVPLTYDFTLPSDSV